MKTIPLKYPLEIEGKMISSLNVRRPKASDMIAIGDHLPALAALDRDNPAAAMTSATFKAMTAIVGVFTGLGAAAEELDAADLTTVATEAIDILGEADGSDGTQKAGA